LFTRLLLLSRLSEKLKQAQCHLVKPKEVKETKGKVKEDGEVAVGSRSFAHIV